MKKKRLLQKIWVMSKITFYALFMNCLLIGSLLAYDIHAQSVKSVKEVEISVNFKNADISEVFKIIEKHTYFNDCHRRYISQPTCV